MRKTTLTVFLLLLAAWPGFGGEPREADGFYRILRGGKWGYMDRGGKVVIEPAYDQVLSFSEGLAPVRVGKLWGYTDRNGKVAIPPQFDWAGVFREGRAHVRAGDRMGYIDHTGKPVIPLQYPGVYPFSDGLGMVARDWRSWSQTTRGLTSTRRERRSSGTSLSR